MSRPATAGAPRARCHDAPIRWIGRTGRGRLTGLAWRLRKRATTTSSLWVVRVATSPDVADAVRAGDSRDVGEAPTLEAAREWAETLERRGQEYARAQIMSGRWPDRRAV